MIFEFRPETQKFMFVLAKIFGKKITKNLYAWRGKIWVTGELETE